MPLNAESTMTALRSLHPQATDEELGQKFQSLQTGADPVLARSVINEIYSPSRRSELLQKAKQEDMSVLGGVFDSLAAIGAGLSGGNAAQTGSALREARTARAMAPVAGYDKEHEQALSEATTGWNLFKQMQDEIRAKTKSEQDTATHNLAMEQGKVGLESSKFELEKGKKGSERGDIEYARKQKDLADDEDPMSEKSKLAQDLVAKTLGKSPDELRGHSAARLGQVFPILKAVVDEEYRKQEQKNRQEDRELTRAGQQQEREDRRADRLVTQQATQATRELARADRLDRQEEAREEKRKKDATLSDKQLATITSYDNVLSSLKSIRRQKKDVETGPVASRQNQLAAFFGIDDANVSVFKANLVDQLAQYTKSISGSAVSEQEAQRLAQSIPSMGDNNETFIAKLNAFEARIKGYRKTELMNLKKRGKDVSEFEDDGDAPGKLATPPSSPFTKPESSGVKPKPTWAR